MTSGRTRSACKLIKKSLTYSEAQLQVITAKNKRPDLKKLPKASLDAVIIEFLKKYEVYACPVIYDPEKSGNDFLNRLKKYDAAVAGAINGVFGVDVGRDAFIAAGHDRQTQVKEWTRWKQWALDRKDFEAFKNDFFDKVKKHNKDIDKKLSDPEFQKEVIEPILQSAPLLSLEL